jgi:hypothetical protein
MRPRHPASLAFWKSDPKGKSEFIASIAVGFKNSGGLRRGPKFASAKAWAGVVLLTGKLNQNRILDIFLIK